MNSLEVPLAEICEVNIGRTPSRSNSRYWSGGSEPWVMISDLTEDDPLQSTAEQITRSAVSECGCKLVPAGTVLLSFKLSVGKVSIAGIPVYTNEAIAALPIRDRRMVDLRYLYHALKRYRWDRVQTDRAAKGLTLNKAKLETLPIPIPGTIDDQRRIAAILDKTDAICRKRQQVVKLADDFLRSVFLDMFGDPVVNPKQWPTKPLVELGVLARGKSKHRPRNDPRLLGGPYPLIQTGDVRNSGDFIYQYKQTYSDFGLAQSLLWPAGTLCITIAANIADTAILTFDACFPDSVVGFTPYEEVASEYVHYWLKGYQKVLQALAPESAQKNINLEILEALPVPHPSIDLQQRFSTVFHRVEKLRTRLRRAIVESHDLSNGIARSVFQGNH
jgi:type I restriction enzyme S subunit